MSPVVDHCSEDDNENNHTTKPDNSTLREYNRLGIVVGKDEDDGSRARLNMPCKERLSIVSDKRRL